MAEKIEHLHKFEDDRGRLYLFDLDKIGIGQVSKKMKVYFGKQMFNKTISEDTFFVCVQGKLTLKRLDVDTTKALTLLEHDFCRVEDTSYDLSSSEGSIFVEILLSHTSGNGHNKNWTQVVASEMQMRENTIDLSPTLINLDFGVKRLFYIKDVPNGKIRGDHSHSSCAEIMMTIKGRFTLTENNQKAYLLDNSSFSYLIPADTLTKESDFSEDAICLVLADTAYDPSGYY